MQTWEMQRLQADGPSHLDRYQRAKDAGASNVLDAGCPDCGVAAGVACDFGAGMVVVEVEDVPGMEWLPTCPLKSTGQA